MEQVEGNIKADDFLNRYLVSLMLGNSKDYHTGVAEIPDSAYVRYWVDQQDVAYDEALHAQLFTPLTGDLRYLLCRQIVRELGEVNNLRGCGIKAQHVQVGAVLPLQNEDGNRFLGLVLAISDDKVKIDLNHPLSGKKLNFCGEVLESREATAEEVAHMAKLMSGEAGGGCGGNCGDCKDGGCKDGNCGDGGCENCGK